jgi:peptidylprolyl isomerase
MFNSQRTKQERRAARARAKLARQLTFWGVIILVAIFAIWMIIKGMKPTLDSSQETVKSGPTPMLVGTKQYSSAPPMLIDINKKYYATVRMAKGGEFVIQLFPDKAPNTVNSFVFLARNGYYDSVTFHRVLEGFMAQTGDPTGTGGGNPGFSFGNEVNDLAYDKAGVVGMANTGQPNSNGSQFFIMFGPYGLSEADYTIFGQVISGMDVVNEITRRDPSKNPDYSGDVIESIRITEK